MSLQDSLFAEDVECDVTLFSRDKRRKRVLVFPPVNNYRRFVIHQLVQDRFIDLHTFSIGQGPARRTVVCYKIDVIRDPKLNGAEYKSSHTTRSTDTLREMGVEGRRSPSASPERVRAQRQVKSAPAVEIYRPPAARRAKNDLPINTEQNHGSPIGDQSSTAKTSRQRRPDRAVYVPRHRRSLEPEGSPQPLEISRTGRTAREGPRIPSPSISHGNSKSKLNPKERYSCVQESMECQKPERNTRESAGDSLYSNKTDSHTENETDQCTRADLEDPVSLAAPIVEPCSQDTFERLADCEDENLQKQMENSAAPQVECERTDVLQSEAVEEERVSNTSPSEKKIHLDPIETCVYSEVNVNEEIKKTDDYEDNVTATSPVVNNQEQGEFFSKDEIANHKNTQMVRRNLVSDVLIISDARKEPKPVKDTPSVTMIPPEKKVKKIERLKSKPAPPPSPPVEKINRDECDWDSLFDDNGDCLDPTIIEELTSAVGEVVIEQPKNDYKAYTKQIEVSSDEFAHVVEIYNFPSEFKTSDLAAAFSPFKNGGFELKWVDDTHCLGVFSSPLVAAEVLASDHPFVKTRPLSEATALSKTKARRSAEFLQPYRSRPETCAALARRLVTGALGVKLATARQEREHEKNVLREAKEKRRLANKQREDAWEGIIPEK